MHNTVKNLLEIENNIKDYLKEIDSNNRQAKYVRYTGPITKEIIMEKWPTATVAPVANNLSSSGYTLKNIRLLK